ncbi:MAG: DUF1249 domain-containing protein [Gammaproteobacteria bacterium]|nr:DUF1249 domain-containing protein [Gammaproteobacteria bacterium]
MRQNNAAYGCEDVTPRGFVSLMDLYENNYIRLRKLLPDVNKIDSAIISRVPEHLDLYLNIIERSKFTTTLYLSYCFPTEHGLKMEPNLKIRIYHDAQLAEVMAGHLHHGRLVLDDLPADALKEKWQLNRFLNKWLGYCLKQGHSFAAIAPVPIVNFQQGNKA